MSGCLTTMIIFPEKHHILYHFQGIHCICIGCKLPDVAARYQEEDFSHIYVMQLRSGEDPELRNTLKNASYRGGRAAKCFKYSPTEGDGSVRAIRSSQG